jgi:protein-S-isoprenylcysteine O-methyltransferase Ste14
MTLFPRLGVGWLNGWLLLVVYGLVFFRILAEERSCLLLYGDAYRDYLARVPRYLLFF